MDGPTLTPSFTFGQLATLSQKDCYNTKVNRDRLDCKGSEEALKSDGCGQEPDSVSSRLNFSDAKTFPQVYLDATTTPSE